MIKIRTLPSRIKLLDMDTAKPAAKVADQLYSSKAWLGLMARLKSERGSVCQHCDATGRVVGDHIVELKDGGAALEPANVQLLCWSCHTTKTNKSRSARIAKPLMP